MSSDFFQSELTWALAIACRDGRAKLLLFSMRNCWCRRLLLCSYVQRKTRKKYAVALAFLIVKRHAVTW